jgi:hypothetical protein
MERPLVPPHDAGTRQQAQQVAEQSDFPWICGIRRLGPGRYTITSLRQELVEQGRGCFYTAEPDLDSESDSYDPTRECFNIDGAVATTDDTQDATTVGRGPAAREDPRTPRNDGQVDPLLRTTKLRNLRNCESSRPSLMRITSASPNSSGISSKTNRTHMVGARVVVLERCINRLSGMRS